MEEQAKKKKKANPLVKLGILLLAALALFAAWRAMKTANEKKAAAEAARLAAESASQTVTVASFDPAEMTELSYDTPGSTDGTLSFVVVNGSWQWKDDAAFPLDQIYLASMGSAVTEITAVRQLKESEVEGGLAACGLNEPSCTVTVKYGGEKHVYETGAYNGTYQAYYLRADGALYLTQANLASTFSKTLDSLLKRDSVPSADWTDRSLISSVIVKDGGESREITDEDEIDAVMTALSSVYLSRFADYNADEAEKAAFGLDGSRSVTVKYRKSVSTTDANGNSSTSYLETSYEFLIGNPYEEDETLTAVCPPGSSVVYLISTEKTDEMLG